MRNPQLAKAFGKSLSGGLLLYGPPGCGKTFIARAVAGELGARFFSVGIADVLDMYTGQSERNLARDLRRGPPRTRPACCSSTRSTRSARSGPTCRTPAPCATPSTRCSPRWTRVAADNDGVFVLGATNHPWDIDSALRRPGRFDRMLLVLPPDAPGPRRDPGLPPAGPAGVGGGPRPDRPAHRALLRRRPRARLHHRRRARAGRVDARRQAARAHHQGPRGGRAGRSGRAPGRGSPPPATWSRSPTPTASYDDLSAYLRRNKQL